MRFIAWLIALVANLPLIDKLILRCCPFSIEVAAKDGDRTFRVFTNLFDGPLSVAKTPGIPAIGERHSGTASRQIKTQRIFQGRKVIMWKVDVFYVAPTRITEPQIDEGWTDYSSLGER